MSDELMQVKPLAFAEALSRIVPGEKITVMFQGLPDVTGVNHVMRWDRKELLAHFAHIGADFFESGPAGIKMGFGIYGVFTLTRLGRGQLFIKTDATIPDPQTIQPCQ